MQDIPPDMALVMAVNPVKREYETWRVVVYKRDGSWFYYANNKGLDYVLERNARWAAERYNACRMGGAGSFAKAIRVKIIESEIEV